MVKKPTRVAKKAPAKKKVAPKKRLPKLDAGGKSENGLTIRQELFCYYFTSMPGCFNNATQAYLLAYGIDKKDKSKYASARTSARRLMTNADIKRRLEKLLEEAFTDEAVDKEHAKIILQNFDLWVKMRGISEYNKVKWRVKDPWLTVNIFTEEELEE